MIRNYRLESGQTLIEVMIALGIAVVIVSAITIAVVIALDNTSYSRNQNLATQFAQEGMEIVRQKRDTNLTSFQALTDRTYCLAKGSTTLVRKQENFCTDFDQSSSLFRREIEIYHPPDSSSCDDGNADTESLTKVVSTVFWTDGKCPEVFCQQVSLESCLAN